MENVEFFQNLNQTTLFPFENLKGNDNYIYANKKKKDFYTSLLMKSICKNSSEESLQKYCALNDFDQNDLILLLSEKYKEKEHFPNWMYTLEKCLNYFDTKNISFGTETQEIPFYQLLTPFVRLCFSNFIQNLSQKGVHTPSTTVIKCLEKALYKELFILSYTVLYEEFLCFLKEHKKSDETYKREDHFYTLFIHKNVEDKLNGVFSNA